MTLRAPAALVGEMAAAARALPEGALPDDLLADEAWSRLAFSLERYEPESVSVVTRDALG